MKSQIRFPIMYQFFCNLRGGARNLQKKSHTIRFPVSWDYNY
jgi:hypothetical protein